VKVIPHQAIGEDEDGVSFGRIVEDLEEPASIAIVFKDRLLSIPAGHDVVGGSWDVQSGRFRHASSGYKANTVSRSARFARESHRAACPVRMNCSVRGGSACGFLQLEAQREKTGPDPKFNIAQGGDHEMK
jgi:hypothetical protein